MNDDSPALASAAADKRTSARPVGSLGTIYTIMLVRAEEFDYKLECDLEPTAAENCAKVVGLDAREQLQSE